MQYSQEHLKTMVYAKFGGQAECIMGNWKIENGFFYQIEHRQTLSLPHFPKGGKISKFPIFDKNHGLTNPFGKFQFFHH